MRASIALRHSQAFGRRITTVGFASSGAFADKRRLAAELGQTVSCALVVLLGDSCGLLLTGLPPTTAIVGTKRKSVS